MKQEHLLENEIKSYLENRGWTVKQQTPRQDCITWEHPYTADLIIKHQAYEQLGWIGLELKDQNAVAEALQQTLTKYQNYYFKDIQYPLRIWGIIINSPSDSDQYWFGRKSEQRIILQQFGIGYMNWGESKDCIKFISGQEARASISLDPYKENRTDQQLLKKFCFDKSDWIKHINFKALRWD